MIGALPCSNLEKKIDTGGKGEGLLLPGRPKRLSHCRKGQHQACRLESHYRAPAAPKQRAATQKRGAENAHQS